MPILPPDWTWLDNGSATNGVDLFRHRTLDESASQAWRLWTEQLRPLQATGDSLK